MMIKENKKKSITLIVPFYNEGKNISLVYSELKDVLNPMNYDHEIIFIDDGSTDESSQMAEEIARKDGSVRFIQFSRNFGKEIATTAGLCEARGDAAIMIDADLQHPPREIPTFVQKWEQGAEIVIGVRNGTRKKSFLKRTCACIFYKLINLISETKIVPHATDFRLLDRIVVDEFCKFTERNRMTRGLIDWLGFRRDFVYFNAAGRKNGEAKYNIVKLTRLAVSGVVSHSYFPLKFAGYLGMFIVLFSGPLGLFIFLEKYVLKDPFGFNFSGPAILAVIILFLIGIVLICLGLVALYIANIQSEVVNRPIYVIRRKV